jgi:ABC-2 type transport system permease protein
VRERLNGSFELYRISPLTPLQLLLGKYAGYVLLIAGVTVGLVLVIVFGLRVPFVGSVWRFALAALLMLLAALGIGFSFSALARTDSQAVQFSMLLLLASLFFSGFFLPIDSFAPWVSDLSKALPLTHGIILFQDEMLTGRAPSLQALAWMLGHTLVGFLGALGVTAYQFRRG